MSKRIDFSGRVTLVTGAGSGLGRWYALELARRGAAVVVNDLGTSIAGTGAARRPADAVVQEIIATGGKAIPSYDSVTSSDGGAAIIEQAVNAYGRLDAVINNAGTLINSPFEALTDETIDAMIDVHLKGAFNITRPAYRVMKEQGYGRIVFTSSSVAVFGNETQTAYGAAKAGLIGLMNSLSQEAVKHNVYVNTLLPTGATRLADAMDPENAGKTGAVFATAADLLENSMDQRFMAPLAVFLASEACTSTQGVYTGVMGRFANVFTGLTPGWFGPRDQPASVEDVAKHFKEIVDRADYTVPRHITDEYVEAIRILRTNTTDPS